MKSKNIIKMDDLEERLTQLWEAMSGVQLCGNQDDIESFLDAKNKLADFIDKHWPKPFEMP